jgi:hypothetical protein
MCLGITHVDAGEFWLVSSWPAAGQSSQGRRQEVATVLVPFACSVADYACPPGT